MELVLFIRFWGEFFICELVRFLGLFGEGGYVLLGYVCEIGVI